MPPRVGPRKTKPERYRGPAYESAEWMEMCRRVCERIGEGYSLNRSMEMEDCGLYAAIVHSWRVRHPELDALYQDARMSQLEAWADEIVDIADGLKRTDAQREEICADAGGNVGKAKRITEFKCGDEEGNGNGKKGKSKANYDYHAVKRDYLRIDSRKWLLSKLNPAKWGDRVQTQVTGPEGGALMVQVVRFGDLPPGDVKELRDDVVDVKRIGDGETVG